MRRMLTAKMNNTSGVLNRFTGILSRRQVNIESISVGPTDQPHLSRITIVIDVASLAEVELVVKQLNRMVDVVRVRDITDVPHLEREVALIKINAPANVRAEVFAMIQPFRASVIDVATKTVTIQSTGSSDKIDALLKVVQPYGIKNLARTGVTGFSRG
ncbi:MAG: acetolactate synthase small subunit [Streptococcaceae bacterium]|nr:acetolactate synthase small subunit [Streptococcaceae bacterium]